MNGLKNFVARNTYLLIISIFVFSVFIFVHFQAAEINYLLTFLFFILIIAIVYKANQLQKQIDDLKQNEVRLKNEEINYRILINEAPLAVWVMDQDFKIVETNQFASTMLGYEIDELIGLNPVTLIEPNDLANRPFRYQKIFDGETVSGERLMVCKDGNLISVIGSTRKLSNGRFLSVLQDISSRREKEKAIIHLKDELEVQMQERTSELEISARELEAFSYTVSHDLRAPLRAVSGFSELLFQNHASQLDKDGLGNLNRIRENIRKMGMLIDDLLAFSRLGKGNLYPQTVYVLGLVEDVIASFEGETASRKVTFEIGHLPDCVADYAMLRQIFANLIDNALKYSRAREQAVVSVGAEVNGNEIIYFVNDNGIGFDMRYANKLFGVFNRLHHEDEFEGTGIGLAIVQRVVLRHGGRVWVDAAVDRGAKFFFTIPVLDEDNTALSGLPAQKDL